MPGLDVTIDEPGFVEKSAAPETTVQPKTTRNGLNTATRGEMATREQTFPEMSTINVSPDELKKKVEEIAGQFMGRKRNQNMNYAGTHSAQQSVDYGFGANTSFNYIP